MLIVYIILVSKMFQIQKLKQIRIDCQSRVHYRFYVQLDILSRLPKSNLDFFSLDREHFLPLCLNTFTDKSLSISLSFRGSLLVISVLIKSSITHQ